MNKTDYFEKRISSLKIRERAYICLLIVLLSLIFILSLKGKNYVQDNDAYFSAEENIAAPYSKEIHGIIANLKYSGVEMFLRDDVTLSLDYANKIWTLHNLHRFDPSGDIILEKGTDGTCGELAAYVYKRVKPIFGNKYEIKFVKSAQSGFFLTQSDSHITLNVSEKGSDPRKNKIYIIDPSFHRYGHISKFEDYLFTGYLDSLPFVDKKEVDVDNQIRSAIPLFLGGDYLLGFAVESNNGLFNKENFVLAIVLTKKYNYAGRYLFAIRNNNGMVEQFENMSLARRILSDKEYNKIVAKIKFFFKELTN